MHILLNSFRVYCGSYQDKIAQKFLLARNTATLALKIATASAKLVDIKQNMHTFKTVKYTAKSN
jgi:hypothetical protein